MLQSVVFRRHAVSMEEAKRFLHRHGYRSDKVDVTDSTIRFRQLDPKPLERKGMRFRTKELPDKIGFLVLAYPSTEGA